MSATPLSHQLSRRGFLRGAAGTAALFAVGGLAACGSDSSSSPGRLVGLLPGNEPAGWPEVQAAVNEKLEADLGFTFEPEFISWDNYFQNELLKFTAGEDFDTALEARWLHLDQLISDGALADLAAEWDSGKYEELTASIDERHIQFAKTGDKLFAIPQVNTAGIVNGFVVRQDLVEKYGIGEITNFQQLEKYFYDVKQNEPGMIPYGLDSGYVNNTAIAQPIALFNEQSWEEPNSMPQNLGGSKLAYMDLSDVAAGNSRPLPFWEQPGVIDAIKKVRQYFLDGIINHDSVTVEKTTVFGQFTTGLYAATEANSDGLTTSTFLPTTTNIPGSAIAQVHPFAAGLQAKVASLFSADNYMVVNAASDGVERAMQLQNWLSIKENHDLLAYGIEGRDWTPVGNDQYELTSEYSFPIFGIGWRVPLERTVVGMVDSERAWFDWARNFDSFVADPYAGFLFDPANVEAEIAQLIAAYTQYALPLFAGSVDTTPGLSDCQRAFEAAGYEKVLDEMKTQADAFLAAKG
ncbi:ABC transporter substrate-binding protein [Jiangella anatolica]|uniref:DUF3502 domain-containing protein n=1 Tax=Jiangella anatolica TaxID=2670374 RepID=A0A2W2BV61_9ACTN|nr:DUF3502 domain-containing protein [Jiangella anatolica]PZF80039.1 hypothetical protein C1I92_28045 [Jiangella anatolica]